MNQEEQQLKKLRLGKNAFTVHNFYELEDVEQDRAVYRLDIRPESLNPYGMVHGGALYTMADDAAGSAAHTDGRHYVTQNGSLHFLKNQGSGPIRAEGPPPGKGYLPGGGGYHQRERRTAGYRTVQLFLYRPGLTDAAKGR